VDFTAVDFTAVDAVAVEFVGVDLVEDLGRQCGLPGSDPRR
jgi:hypothetical protein